MPTTTKKSPTKSSATKSRKAPAAPDRARRRTASIPAEGPISLQEARALVSPPTLVKPKARAAPTAKAARRTPVARAALPESTPEALGAQRKRTQLAQRDEVKQRIKDYKAMLQLMKRRGVKGLAPSAEAASPGRRRAPSAGGAPLQVLAAAHPGVTVIDAQGTLAPVRELWHNELHPSRKGFEAFATRFHTELRTMFPGRVL